MLIGITKRSETIVFHRAFAIADFNLGSGTARHQSLASGSLQLRRCAFWTVSLFLSEKKKGGLMYRY